MNNNSVSVLTVRADERLVRVTAGLVPESGHVGHGHAVAQRVRMEWREVVKVAVRTWHRNIQKVSKLIAIFLVSYRRVPTVDEDATLMVRPRVSDASHYA